MNHLKHKVMICKKNWRLWNTLCGYQDI